jgi:hypothetical protein
MALVFTSSLADRGLPLPMAQLRQWRNRVCYSRKQLALSAFGRQRRRKLGEGGLFVRRLASAINYANARQRPTTRRYQVSVDVVQIERAPRRKNAIFAEPRTSYAVCRVDRMLAAGVSEQYRRQAAGTVYMPRISPPGRQNSSAAQFAASTKM